ncbi:PEP-CTERM putative exosortase interaction domain-containing protein [Methylophilaceae bacterium 11]|nr:PEP-CTERM putative exosortase interaction domain-containing protein [Methylophilaceae bacterium 11]
MQITFKTVLAIVLLLPEIVSASTEIVILDDFYLSDPPRGSKLISATTEALAKNVILSSGIRPISEVYSDTNIVFDDGLQLLNTEVGVEQIAARWGTRLPSAPIITPVSSNGLSIANHQSLSLSSFGALSLNNGGDIYLRSDNTAILAGIVFSSSQSILSGNISLSSGAALVLTAVPEPSNLSMLVIGLLAISLVNRRKFQKP